MFLLSCHRVTGLDSHVVSQHYFMFGLTLKRHKHHMLVNNASKKIPPPCSSVCHAPSINLCIDQGFRRLSQVPINKLGRTREKLQRSKNGQFVLPAIRDRSGYVSTDLTAVSIPTDCFEHSTVSHFSCHLMKSKNIWIESESEHSTFFLIKWWKVKVGEHMPERNWWLHCDLPDEFTSSILEINKLRLHCPSFTHRKTPKGIHLNSYSYIR